MDDSLAAGNEMPLPWEQAAWKSIAATVGAVVIGVLFLVSGIWKLTDPLDWTTKIEQFKVPYSVSLPFTLALAIGETWGAVMILVPRFRRWGAIMLSVLLVGFMAYMGIHYVEFKNMDCSCFPLLKRAIGPGFFIGDAAMLILAGLADGGLVRLQESARPQCAWARLPWPRAPAISLPNPESRGRKLRKRSWPMGNLSHSNMGESSSIFTIPSACTAMPPRRKCRRCLGAVLAWSPSRRASSSSPKPSCVTRN